MRVKAICNFADDGHRQGDIFDVEEAEAEHLIAIEAVELTDDELPEEINDPNSLQSTETPTGTVTASEAPADDIPLVNTPPDSGDESNPQSPTNDQPTLDPAVPTPPAPGQPTAEQVAATLAALDEPPAGSEQQPAR